MNANERDLISRQAAIEAASDGCFELRGVFEMIKEKIEALPPALPASKWVHGGIGMSKKYILETDCEIPFDKNARRITIDLQKYDRNKLYPFDESAVELQGAEKAWEFCRFLREECDYREVYGMSLTDIMDMSYQDARAKYEAWQKEVEIKVGDEVWNTNNNVKAVVLEICGDKNDPTAKVYERNIGFNYPPLRALRKVDKGE